MGLRRDLCDLLMALPGMDSPDERKALLSYLGFSNYGTLLDWQGSKFVFVDRLVSLLGGSGKDAMVQFITALRDAPQVGVSRKPALDGFLTQLGAMDTQAFDKEFTLANGGTETPPAVRPKLVKLTGAQFGQLQNALVASFNLDGLRMMARTQLETNLDTIASSSNLQVAVYDLIRWAERTGALDRLLDGALAVNGASPELQAVDKALRG
ncbi:MAG: hypothetical protein IPK16_12395 [Anaerolineales bacterium]|nr:hypothetical protein [Anaerolineales bacterium]